MKEKNIIIHRIDNSSDGLRYYEGLKEDIQQWCYPSVTAKLEIAYPLDFQLVNYIREKGEDGKNEFKKAGEEGSRVHEIIEKLIIGDKISTFDLSRKVKKCVQAFIDWVSEVKPVFLETEKTVWNHKYKYAGTRDLLARIYGEIWLIDYKTSSTTHEKHKVQVSAYWACGNKKVKTALLHLGNKTKKHYSWVPFDPKPYFKQFREFNKIFEILRPEAHPSIVKYPEFFELK